MANVWKKCDSNVKAEHRLAEQLAAIDDPNLILLFNIGFIPGGREIDILLIHELIGVFIIESKGVSINALGSISPMNWSIENREATEAPTMQAYRQFEGLRDFLKAHISRLPFIAATACLQRISRSKWRERYADSIYASEIADRLIFEEDLTSGKDVLLNRLRHIHENPPTRQGKKCNRVPQDFLTLLRKILEPSRPIIPTVSERQRLLNLEQGITAKVQADFPPGEVCHAIFSGLPGTGKTFRLLSIGMLHAYAGKRVVFTCFNKTLAADIRRLLSFADKLKIVPHQIDILDINQLALRAFDINGLNFIDSKDADEWGEVLVDELTTNNQRALQIYDLVLVDESQDMKSWQLDLLGLHANAQSSVIIALGEGQELYKDAASAKDWLRCRQINYTYKEHKLNRNFRNPKQQYFFAQAFFDAWPDKFDKIGQCKEHLLKKKSQEILFDRDRGENPKYISLPVDNSEFEFMGAYQNEIASQAFYNVFFDIYENTMADENTHPISLLILVPSVDGLHAHAVRLALDMLCKEKKVDYIDYTKDEARRASATQDQIRLSTFHCARGLEAEHVVIFGLENVEKLGEASGAAPQNLAFIALSRGLFSTTIVTRASPRGKIHSLCERIMQELQ